MSAIDSALGLLQKSKEFDAASLEQASRLGDLKLTEVAETVARTLNLYRQIDGDALAQLPMHVSGNLADHLGEVFKLCDEVLAFDPRDISTLPKREQFKSDANRLWVQAWGDGHPLMAASARYDQIRLNERLTARLLEQQETFASLVSEFTRKTTSVEAMSEKMSAEAADALMALREVTSESGVQFKANHFKSAAGTHKVAAYLWLSVLIVFSAGVAAWALAGHLVLQAMVDDGGAATSGEQLLASKFLVFAVLSFLVITASKSYFAHRHNAILNEHRQNALLTFRAIVEATGDKACRDAILQQAATCIFGQQSSGYSREASGRSPSVNVIEMIGGQFAGRQEP
jgi:hypothetical protein